MKECTHCNREIYAWEEGVYEGRVGMEGYWSHSPCFWKNITETFDVYEKGALSDVSKRLLKIKGMIEESGDET